MTSSYPRLILEEPSIKFISGSKIRIQIQGKEPCGFQQWEQFARNVAYGSMRAMIENLFQ